jgi:hypothetical protein
MSSAGNIRHDFLDHRCPHYEGDLRKWCGLDDYSCEQNNSCSYPDNWKKIWLNEENTNGQK